MKKRVFCVVLASICVAATLAGCGGSSSTAASEKSVRNESAEYYDDEAIAAAAPAYSDDIYEYGETEEAYEETSSASAGSSASSEDVPSDSEIQSNSNRKLIKTVNLTAETREFDSLIANVTERINSLGGYAESMDINGNSYDIDNERSAYIVARIPANKLDSFVKEVTDASNITSKNESAEDVTLQYADVEAHKESLKIEQERLNQLLEQADTLENIIELENRLTQVRYEIESYESRLRTMNNQVVYATVNLSIREVKEYTPEPVYEKTFGERLAEEFLESCENAWETIQDFIIGFVAFLPTLLVIIIILSVIALIVLAIVKAIIAIVKKAGKNKTQKAAAKPAPAAKPVAVPTVKPAAKPEEAKPENENKEQ